MLFVYQCLIERTIRWSIKIQTHIEACDPREAVAEDYKILVLPSNPTYQKIQGEIFVIWCTFTYNFFQNHDVGIDKAIWDFLKEEYKEDECIKGMKVMNLIRELEV